MAVDWSRFKEVISSHQKFIVTSHIRPDCDALGSALGMAGVLEALGKDVKVVIGDVVPPNLAFIDPDMKIKTIGQDVQIEDLADREVLMILDTSAWAQLGPMGDLIRVTDAYKMILDHHVGEDDLGAEPFKETTAAATGRLVVEAAEILGVELTKEMAIPLYAALATDTGWFRFNSVSPLTMEVGGQLIEAGAKPQDIYTELYEQDSLSRLKLRGTILARTETDLDGRLAYTSAFQKDLEVTGAVPTDTEDVVNLTLGVGGVEVAVIFVEQATGGFKLSFRSRSHVNCSDLAQQFGGGGHKAASGAFIGESFEVAQQSVLDAVRLAMR